MLFRSKIAAASYDFDFNAHINLFISSEGGELYSSLAASDRIKSSKIPIHTIVEGIAASGATIISISGAKRFIRKHSLMLIHQLSSEFWGNYAQIEDEKKNLDLLMKIIKEVYLKNTKIPESQLESLLKHDLCLDANECLKYGLVDKII